MASIDTHKPELGLVMDYTLVTGATNFTYNGDMTLEGSVE